MGRGKRRLFFSLPSTIARAFIFPSPQPPYDTRRPLRRIVSKLLLWKYSLPFLEMVGWKGSLFSCLVPRSLSSFAFPWHLALRPQSLAFRARFCSKNGKTKRLKRMQPVQLSDGKTRHTFILRIHPNWQGCWYRRWWHCSTVVHTK